ncbi:MAG: hypothetical protein ABIL62_12090 [Planctomycetota bacterium]
MTELYDVLNALRMADEAGETEDAQKLAEMADRLMKSQPEQPKQVDRSGSYMAKGFAASLGAPVDLITVGLQVLGGGVEEPFGGSKSIERGFEKIGIDIPREKPQETGEYARAGVGEALGMLLPGTGMVKAITKTAGTAGTIAKHIISTMKKYPVSTVAAEVGGGVGMGVGRKVGEERPEFAPYAELAGGVVGSMGPQALSYAPSRLGLRAAKWATGKISTPFTEAGATYRAGDFLKGQVVDQPLAAAAVAKESIGILPPAAMSGEKRLMALYNQIRGLNPVDDAKAIDQISKAAFKLNQEMKALGQESPEIFRAITEKRIASIENRMDTRIVNSMENAQKKLDALPIAQRQSQESIIVKNELTRVMKEEHELVKALWDEVPKKTNVGVENTQKAFAGIIDELATAQRSDIPSVLRNHDIFQEGVKETTVNEMQGLRSKLLEISRHARANGRWNKARISDDVADAILEDIGITANRVATTPEGEQLNTALMASRKFKERFEQGTPGKILGYDKTSAPSVAPEITLDIASRGKNWVDIDKVAITPKAREATERYMARSFTDYALGPNGTIDPRKAARWIQNNEEMLDSFPGLKSRLADIGTSQELAISTKATMETRKAALRDPKISVAGKFLGADVGNEINTIFKTTNPSVAIKQLVRQARKDTTGQAIEGLRGGFIEHIISKSSVGGFNDFGEKTLSGRAVLGFVNNNRDSLRQVFKQEQLIRMQRIGEELAKLETLEATKGMKIEYGDAVSNMLRLASRFGGAAVGRHWGRAVGAGGTVQIPGFFAEQWHKIASRLTKNKFERLVHDAIMSPDGKLLETLLLPMDKPALQKENIKKVSGRINAWLIASGVNSVRDIGEDD